MTLPGLVVDIEARIDKLERGLRRANRAQGNSATAMERRARQSADKINSTYGGMAGGIEKAFKRIGPGLIAGLSIGAITAAASQIGSVVKGVAELGDQAKRAGVSVQALQEMKFVGDQNRIGIDQMVDGLKEMNLRADEFVTTGAGSASESFKRLGFDAASLARKLENPSDLFLELIDRMGELDTAAQIRVSDELFGGGAGERFAELVGKGKDALSATIQEAHATGAVMDAELIAKAQELDRRWAALQSRTSTFFRTFAVEAADAAVKIATLRSDTDDLFRSAQQADGLLGPGVVAELDATTGAADQNAEAIGRLRQQYETLSDQSVALAPSLESAAIQLRAFGEDDAAGELADIAGQMRTLASDMQDGTVSAEDFEVQLQDLIDRAGDAFAGLQDIDRVTFGNVIGQIGGIGSALSRAIELARSLRASLPGASPDGKAAPVTPATQAPSFWDSPDGMELSNPRTTPILTSIPRPQAAPRNPDFGMPPLPDDKPAGGCGASKAGGRSGAAERQSDYAREIAAITEETAALRTEAAELARVATGKTDLANATDLARARADLLAAAQRSGVEITPALRAKIDELAGAYTNAGIEADAAADKIAEIQENSKAGAQAITDVFMGMATGAMTAKQAMAELILQMIKVTLQKRIMAAAESAGPGSIIGFVGKALTGGFSDGGFTGPGGKYQPAGIVHAGEYVLSADAVNQIGVPALEHLHASAKRGYASGGLVGGTSTGKGLALAPVAQAAPVVNISSPVTINGSSGTATQNQDLADRMGRELDATIRRSIIKEIQVQRRPGNMLAGR